ncbi:MAG: propane monooxygenase reductase component [Gaiellaceae bacterium]|jgi:propane monooxygenase reductase subunit|nr:propane monooxygenase reductase component [Gaiellaceae bacterium]MDX6469099.1 propane monooxygenase reductase component [Gaiellaceae bacterium]MDX6473713.1 propane monooxygenase reductase component [Gaiellaceae bacterium]
MGEMHTVRLEPVGIEFEVDEDDTVLNGAFKQGLMLMHGCKEGQCAACKSFLLEGEVDLDRYSNFALPDGELEEGWTLLCKSHAITDLTVELINYDEEILRSGVMQRTLTTRVEAIEPLTRDIRRLVLSLTEGEMPFHPGQYVDIQIPGTDEYRSFSMANLPSSDGHLEFMIKLYPGGRFSSLLSEGTLQVGDELDVTGPYGVFTLRNTDRPILFVGGGAGMAPILSLLRSMAEQGIARPAVYYYGAREEDDLFHLEELLELQGALPGFSFVPALSDADWDGESGLITDVVDRLEADLAGFDAYLCGPPPMVDAAQEMLIRRGIDEANIHFDKFTTTATTEENSHT